MPTSNFASNSVKDEHLIRQYSIIATLVFCLCTLSCVSLMYDRIISQRMMESFTELKEKQSQYVSIGVMYKLSMWRVWNSRKVCP